MNKNKTERMRWWHDCVGLNDKNVNTDLHHIDILWMKLNLLRVSGRERSRQRKIAYISL